MVALGAYKEDILARLMLIRTTSGKLLMDNEKGVAEGEDDWYVAMPAAGSVAEGLGSE